MSTYSSGVLFESQKQQISKNLNVENFLPIYLKETLNRFDFYSRCIEEYINAAVALEFVNATEDQFTMLISSSSRLGKSIHSIYILSLFWYVGDAGAFR